MKRSEIIQLLKNRFDYSSDIWVEASQIVDYLVSQGMQPPTCIKEKPLTPNMPIYDRHGKVTYKAQVNEWEPEDER
jgi:hypothetical protein